jgi:hypothetical protein
VTTEQVNLILTAVSALGALGATIAAWRSARATSRVAEAQLFAAQYAEYGTPEMLRSLRMLRLWQSEMGDEFELKWKKALEAGDARAHDIDNARRQVKFYFMKAFRLYEAGYVSRRFLREFASVDGLNILYDIVEPLECALNPRYDASRFQMLRTLCGRAFTGHLIAPVTPAPRVSAGGKAANSAAPADQKSPLPGR